MTTPTSIPRNRLYGRRKGHPLRDRQAALVSDLLPMLAVDLEKPFAQPAALKALDLEIGFGGGEHLIRQAQTQPDIGFIGCEPFINGLSKAISAIDAGHLTNIRLHHGDAAEVLDWLPPASIRRIYILYPDPWPKKRHWKRRFISDDNIKKLTRVLIPDGELRFASDWADYSAWTLQKITPATGLIWTAEQADDWHHPWEGWQSTRYEMKALREGRTPCYLTFRKQS